MYLFVDTETTGLPLWNEHQASDRQPNICQLAAVLVDEKRQTVGEFCALIRPHGWEIPQEATAIHGLTTEQCERYGVPLRRALLEFAWMATRAKICAAHNWNFDRWMIQRESDRVDLDIFAYIRRMDTFCTMQAATDVCKLPARSGSGYKWPSLAEAYLHLTGETLSGAHNALADARACRRIYFALQDRRERGGA